MAGTLVVSLDFELFWGMLEVVPFENYKNNVLGGRQAIPRLLRLFREHDIHATWGVVGFMFAHNQAEARKYFPAVKPTYDNPELDPYSWFDRIGDNEEQAPCFFAPSLIRMVADTQGQEIGSHTFCHYYCREPGQNPEQFRADMQAAKAIAGDQGYDLTSVILPRDYSDPQYIEVLQQLGFSVYRSESNDWIHNKLPMSLFRRGLQLLDVYFPLTGLGGYVPEKEHGIWNLTGSRLYKAIFPQLHFLEGLKIHRIKAQMRHAAKHNLTFHLWWHPHNVGLRTEEHMDQLEEIFRYYDFLKEKYGMRSLNMKEAGDLLQKGQY